MFVPEPRVGEGGVAATQPAVVTSAAGHNGDTMVGHPVLEGSPPAPMAASRPSHPMPIKGPVGLLIVTTSQDPESQCGGRSEQQNIHLQ